MDNSNLTDLYDADSIAAMTPQEIATLLNSSRRHVRLVDLLNRELNSSCEALLTASGSASSSAGDGKLISSEIAHELNQPLAVISTFTDTCLRLLESEECEVEAIRQAMNEVMRQTHRARDIVQAMTSLNLKSDSGRVRIGIDELVSSVVALVDSEAKYHGVRLKVEMPPVAVRVHVNTVLIEQVLLNLVRNAVEAIRDAGGEKLVRPSVAISVIHDSVVQITVDDNGPGVDESHLERLFDPFFTTKGYGTGLGLHLSRMIVVAHGGHLWAGNHSGGGARLRFTLPIVKEDYGDGDG